MKARARLLDPTALVGVALALTAAGCGGGEAPEASGPAAVPTSAVAGSETPVAGSAREPGGRVVAAPLRTARPHDSERSGPYPGRTEVQAARQVIAAIEDTRRLGPTLVVWHLDRSASARSLVAMVGREVQAYYRDESRQAAGQREGVHPLWTGVVSFGADVQWVLDPPTTDPSEALAALDVPPLDASGQERTFSAIETALDRFAAWRIEQRRQVMLVVVTDEAGDDAELVDSLIETPRRYAIPVYVIGVPAPLGRRAASPETLEASLDPTQTRPGPAIRQGPESRHRERLPLSYWGPMPVEHLDSGFGPFALEWLCRASGGAFLAVRPGSQEPPFSTPASGPWPPRAAIQFDASVMRRYQPDYVSEADYLRLLDNQPAKRAVHEAAQLTMPDVRFSVRREFEFRDEADLNRRLTEAQQTAARLQPEIDRLHEILRRGEAEREQLTSRRWQAAYDLAMGQLLAIQVRVDGYNSMLALLKRGRNFERPDSRRWVLEPSQEIETGSALQTRGARARMYLERVVEQHRGTPWAYVAQAELESPVGWQWTEQP